MSKHEQSDAPKRRIGRFLKSTFFAAAGLSVAFWLRAMWSEDEKVISKWHYSTADLLTYITGWSVLAACFTAEQSNDLVAVLSLLGLMTLPGALFCGTLGYAVGGRRLFRPAALCGTSVWMLANIVPVIVWNFLP